MNLKNSIRDVPDFPKKGIVFKDITPLLKDPLAFREVIEKMKQQFQDKGVQKICAIESRGFMFGCALALEMGLPFIPVRKIGKLPWTRISQEYKLEYGTDTIEIHTDAFEKGERVLIVDDVLATGGTARAVCDLLQKIEVKIVALTFLMELDFLNGRELLKSHEVYSVIHY